MRRRPVIVILLAGLLYGGYTFFKKYEIVGLDHLSVRPRTTAASTGSTSWTSREVATASVPVRSGDSIRIATFNIQVFGIDKLGNPQVMRILADTVRKFDAVAIQEIRSTADDIMPRFVDLINSTGRHYDYVIGPRLGRTSSKEQYAFIFDAQTIEVDRGSMFTVEDRDDLLHREPLVALFRVRSAPPHEAFTFTLMDIHTDPDEVKNEVNALASAYQAVRNVRFNGFAEDDTILLGDFNADEKHFGFLASIPNMNWVVSGVTTNTRGTHTLDNILFNRSATVEFTGRWGVLDLVREFNLTEAQALQVSDHLPVWAEFSVYEGGQPGRVARLRTEAQKR
ncbi:MAG: endonuclease/exonuclease/phosphatase family protein [Pirellulales bacterium]|nr:endonuclease/exonuclease/phosphatase family protein [Pirellulales bacterium]